MSGRHKLTITVADGEDGSDHSLSGIPSEAWSRFVEAAKLQFPKDGDEAWAAFLSEVILSASGGDKTVSYFMTDVPKENDDAITAALSQIGMTWDRLHAYLLRAAIKPAHLRLVALHDGDGKVQHYGTLLVVGIDPISFNKLEASTDRTFEQIIGTIMLAAAQGEVRFDAQTTFAEPSPAPTGQGRGAQGPDDRRGAGP